jgi:S1-C subfamily serine protease
MFLRKLIRSVPVVAVVGSACASLTFAQKPAQPPKKASTPAQVSSRLGSDKIPPAPQVVTIVHRLNGLKMFRMLLRSEDQVQAIASLDSAFNLMDDVHTNVIAGLAMDDGETIAAWLPEADVEFGPPNIPFAAPAAPLPTKPATTSTRFGRSAVGSFKTDFFETPDLTVIGPDGKHLLAEYIGLDAVTGLSILRLAKKNPDVVWQIKDERADIGENVRLFGPEPVTRLRAAGSGSLYVRMGAMQGLIRDVMRGPYGGVSRFKVISPRLSQANIGGVALNEAGETLGIVDGIEGTEASILPTELIRLAAKRVLDQKASVPKPWLGVKGEPVAALKLDQIVNHGWQLERANTLADKHRGILLTSIVPGSPASQAALRAGDVILQVNDKDIQNADEFTWLLEQAGPSTSVQLTVARPDRTSEEALSVKLSGVLDPSLSFKRRPRVEMARGFSLIDQGLETIVLRPLVATQLGITAGLLITYVEPSTPAFDAGLQPGDVIQSIDGKPISSFTRASSLPTSSDGTYTFNIVRKKEKFVVTVANPTKKK